MTSALSCCLPCPIEHWVYSDAFLSKIRTAYWFNVPALLGQVFLLVTFAVLPAEKGHGHYLSVGLVSSMVMLEVSAGGGLRGLWRLMVMVAVGVYYPVGHEAGFVF